MFFVCTDSTNAGARFVCSFLALAAWALRQVRGACGSNERHEHGQRGERHIYRLHVLNTLHGVENNGLLCHTFLHGSSDEI